MQTFEEQLATAIVAKMANMTLRDVDEKTTHTSSSGPATRIDPMKFVHTQNQSNSFQSQQYQKQVEYTNQLAEQLCPLPLPQLPVEPEPSVHPPSLPLNSTVTSTAQNNTVSEVRLEKVVEILEKIDDTLNKLVSTIERVCNK